MIFLEWLFNNVDNKEAKKGVLQALGRVGQTCDVIMEIILDLLDIWSPERFRWLVRLGCSTVCTRKEKDGKGV